MEKDWEVDAIRALEKSISVFRSKVNADASSRTGKHRNKPASGSMLDSIGHDKSRFAAGKALIASLPAMLDWDSAPASRRWFLVCVCTNEGQIAVDTDKPLMLKKLNHKVYKALQGLGLNGIGVMDFAPFRKSRLHGRMVYAHPQCVVWTDDPLFKPKKAAERLMQSRRFPNSLGLPSVTIISRKKAANQFRGDEKCRELLFADLKQDQTKASMARLGYYLWKAPGYVKHAYRPAEGKRKVQLRTGIKNYSPKLAAATQSVLNDVPTLDAIFGIGDEGRKLRAEWKRLYFQEIGGRSQVKVEEDAKLKRREMKKAAKRRRARRALISREDSTIDL